MPIDIYDDNLFRKDFPFFESENGEYVYFNSAATALKPRCVIDAVCDYYSNYSANVDRGVDSLGYKVTKMYNAAREKTADFIGAHDSDTVIFTKGATAALNMVAHSFGEIAVKSGDEIVTSMAEHHSNFLPWQQLAAKKGAKLIFAPTDTLGRVTVQALESVMSEKTKIVALNHISNVYGAKNDIKALAATAHKYGAYFVCDGAQGITHEPAEVEKNHIDFYAFSGHKIMGPTGIGVLYGKRELLEQMPPAEFGGEMVYIVDYESADGTQFKDLPERHEAGTPPIGQVIGMGAAIDYISSIGYDTIQRRVAFLKDYMINELEKKCPNIEIYNKEQNDSGIVTFNVKGVHSHDAASVFDNDKIIIRAGHHCSQTSHALMCVPTSLRASLYIYNTKPEIDRFVDAAKKAEGFLDVLFS